MVMNRLESPSFAAYDICLVHLSVGKLYGCNVLLSQSVLAPGQVLA